MASIRGPRRLATFCIGLASVLTAVAGCSSIPFFGGSSGVKKLYIKDYTLNVDARLIAGTSSKAFEDLKIANVRSLRNVGLVYSPNYIFVAEPQLLITASTPLTFPSAETVQEPAKYDNNGNLIQETVYRSPLFIINKTTLTYNVSGYTIPQVVITQQIPIKGNTYELKLSGVAQVNELMASFSKNPATAGTISGNVTVSVDVTDTDAFAMEKQFVVAYTLPLVYSYLPFKPETDQTPQPTPVVLPTMAPTPQPTPVPTPTATPTAAPLSAPASPAASTLF